MPISRPDPTAKNTQTAETVYVWQSLGQPGEYALCTNRDHAELKTANWRFRGDLSTVNELDGMRRDAISAKTANGWPMILNVDRYGNYIY